MSLSDPLISRPGYGFFNWCNHLLFLVHLILSIIFCLYFIYAFVVNLNDNLPWSILIPLEISAILFLTIAIFLVKSKKTLKKTLYCSIITLFIYFLTASGWGIVYFRQDTRGSIVEDESGQDFAGFIIIFLWNFYLSIGLYNSYFNYHPILMTIASQTSSE